MPDIRYIDKDFVSFRFSADGEERREILVFGDKVEVLQEGTGGSRSRIRALELFDGTLVGTVAGTPFRGREKGVLKFSMVDVQVSLISSGDEGSSNERIHPRATLLSALGKASRGDTGIILCTELAAFFAKRDYSHERRRIADYYEGDEAITRAELRKFYGAERRSAEDEKALPSYFGFERTNFGIIHIRTDGERVLVFTHSGKQGMRENYRFTVDKNHRVKFSEVTTG